MKYVDFVKMNLSEYDKNYEALGYEFFERYEDMLIITKGGDGAEYKDKFYSTEYVSTIDVSGAGDTFLAAFAYMYSMTEDMDKAIPFANKMANIVVKKKGVSSIL
jgi:sugar/nucleoside kinase (ribokinase family)